MTGRLDGRTAVITGGSNGIGLACAHRFATEGANIVIADLLAGPGTAATEAIESAGGAALFVELDVASPEANQAMAAAAVDRFGAIDVVVTAAGVSDGGYRSGDIESQLKRIATAREAAAVNPAAALTELDIDNWRRVLDVNLTGTLLSIQATARPLPGERRGQLRDR